MRTRSLIVVLLLLLLPAAGWASSPVPEYQPGWKLLTDQQVINWWATQTEQQQIDNIRLEDQVEHAVPVFEGPTYLATLQGRDLYLTPQYPVGQDYNLMVLGPWDYHVKWKPAVLKDWAPAPVPQWPKIVGAAGIGFGFGLLTGLALAVALHL